jgi:hypothetical protein
VKTLLLLLVLTACAGADDRVYCLYHSGDHPYAWLGGFGGIGAFIANQTPEYQAWQQRREQCVLDREAIEAMQAQ